MSFFLDVQPHDHEGFKVLVTYGAWRAAVLNPGPTTRPELFSYIEKHRETDEVFVLLKGKACLVIGGNGEKPAPPEVVSLEPDKTYNVKADVWHGVVMSADASLYIVENVETGKQNSDYYVLSQEEKETILGRVLLR